MRPILRHFFFCALAASVVVRSDLIQAATPTNSLATPSSARVAPTNEMPCMTHSIFVERLEYDIRWRFLSVGRATIETVKDAVDDTSVTIRSLQVRNHPWTRMAYRVDNRIDFTREETRDGYVSRVHRTIREGSYRQHDELVMCSVSRMAVWTNKLSGVSAEYATPAGVVDYVSLLFEVRGEQICTFGGTNRYHLAMDDSVHRFDVYPVSTGAIRTVKGAISATELRIESKSKDLFSRNLPGSVWVGGDPCVILAMDAATKMGQVEIRLKEWIVNGESAW